MARGIIDIREARRRQGDYYLLWALPRGEKVPFEVSREVPVLIEDRCPTSPYCPGERMPRILPARRRAAGPWTYAEDPHFRMDPERCPMGFRSKEECYRAINVLAFRKGLLPRREVFAVAAFLRSVGYRLHAETFDEEEVTGERILLAHGPLFHFHELRTEMGPGGVRLYLVRNPYENQRPAGARPFLWEGGPGR